MGHQEPKIIVGLICNSGSTINVSTTYIDVACMKSNMIVTNE